MSFFEQVHQCLVAVDLEDKLKRLDSLVVDWSEGQTDFLPTNYIERIADPGRPARPKLVLPKDLMRRRLGSPEGHAALMHAIAHIEFNAINLALDALYRFQDMPRDYYADWLGVATEEAYHFQMIREHLARLGYEYGDFTAHNGLWLTTYETDHDPLVRMAMVPRTLEARGLDVTPDMIKRLRAIGDHRGVEILKILLRDEIGHVAVGTRWFRYLCQQQGLNPFDAFQSILDQYFHGDIRGPFNYQARAEAGFSSEEIAWLKAMEAQTFEKSS
ncbi:ferritin-like domain-containing protein [Thiomicrospira sp. ALE5]|uniref:ferritin-like domain-containing protein n=1 Tax=Thiomicrospira sp. ALE5 TaxID=748650 RepID=UPI0008E9837C|nr:ferritin-like domain-containing protein [Thiomicrospira sp. ALE5]SFR51354.1 Uncharacterized conserved protein, contains ferritin-like DUF455 domain [Thiomicrospira sp. ALE5]